MEKQELWNSVLTQIELSTTEANFNTWFKDTNINNIKDGELTISVPSNFVKEWLCKKYHKSLLTAVRKVDKKIRKINYIISPPVNENDNSKNTDSDENQMNFQDIISDYETGLNPKYSFENYVVGSFNNLAHAASSAVAQEPGSLYNPLFIYSKSGLGKTHLLQATGNRIKNNITNKKVFYVQGQDFVDEVITSIRNNNTDRFKKKYKDIDILIIDDIQFLSGKIKTQEIFFHTFNDLYNNDKQIILSSDRPPREIKELADRLRSRFEGGMMADISYPDIEIRAAILKEKARQRNFIISNEVCLLIAENITRNIRELEGVLNKLIIHEKIKKETVDIKIAKEIIKNLTQTPIETFSFSKILKSVAKFYDIEEREIIGKSRKRELVKSRQIVIYLLKKELGYSYPYIGKKIGNRDHTTIIHSFRKIKNALKNDEDIKDEIYTIRESILSC